MCNQSLKLSENVCIVNFGWVNMSPYNVFVSGPKFINFLFNLGRTVFTACSRYLRPNSKVVLNRGKFWMFFALPYSKGAMLPNKCTCFIIPAYHMVMFCEVTLLSSQIWANAHEMRKSLQQVLFVNCQSISSHFVAVHSWNVRCSRKSQKSIETHYFGSLESFKVIDVDTTKKLITSACCDMEHVHAYQRPFWRKTTRQW